MGYFDRFDIVLALALGAGLAVNIYAIYSTRRRAKGNVDPNPFPSNEPWRAVGATVQPEPQRKNDAGQ